MAQSRPATPERLNPTHTNAVARHLPMSGPVSHAALVAGFAGLTRCHTRCNEHGCARGGSQQGRRGPLGMTLHG